MLKYFSQSNPITLKELSRKCDFCSINTLRNLLDALYRSTNPKNKLFDFRLIKYTKDKERGEFVEWDNNEINSGMKYYYKIEFDTGKAEIKLLTDALSMFPFLSPEQTIKLIKAIEQISSHSDISNLKKVMNGYDYKAYSEERDKKLYTSGELFKTIETITEAMKIKKCIKFDYYMYVSNPGKDRLFLGKRSEKIFHPAFFIWSNGFYYIVGRDQLLLDKNFINLRVDRIKNIEILSNLDKIDIEYINPAEYRDQNPLMYGGDPTAIEFRVKEVYLNVVVDSFGKNIIIKPIDFTDPEGNEYVIVKTNATIDGTAMWLTEYCNHATALSPESLVTKVKTTLMEGLKLYGY